MTSWTIAATVGLSTAARAATPPSEPQILVVVSGYGKDGGKTQPGYEFEEFAQAYSIFRDNGFEVDVASPRGGAVEADAYNPDTPVHQRVLQDGSVMAKLANTFPMERVEPGRYAAVFVVGGKGAMFDLPGSEALQSVIAKIYQRGGVVSAVCHGPAALVNVRLADGRYLVEGKAVNSFTNAEEALFGEKWALKYPFFLEDALTKRGGRFESAPMLLGHVARDGRLIRLYCRVVMC